MKKTKNNSYVWPVGVPKSNKLENLSAVLWIICSNPNAFKLENQISNLVSETTKL